MKINDMFVKDINRSIQGVVKVGQDSTDIIKTELEEYVVTKQLNEHFGNFFNAYRKGTTQNTDKIGVWISGFFGSGKSHFLKIISYLLQNDPHEGKKAIEFFQDKIQDKMMFGDMSVAANSNADVILFNIDAEADTDNRAGKDPIVKVFMKMFNQMQGFCSSMPWVADLERQMVERGVYDSFKQTFEQLAGDSWEDIREEFYFVQDSIIEALDKSGAMSKEAATAWCNRSENEYTLDISTFAKKVREYIELQESKTGKKQFVIFLCDEVGQYIGSSTPLMLNLQNIVEGLGTECGGRAWVICTGQEDIDGITHNLDRDAFSKIIGRFDTRLKLTSSNVDEVIKKRLLDKKEPAQASLRLLYQDKSSVIKNLIEFNQGKQEMRVYDNVDEFVEVYPFIQYQFKLLQEVFNGIRTHGASGKHLSEGERSLLNAFQEAAMQIGDKEHGSLIPFNTFYKTVETFLDHNIQRVISDAVTLAERGTIQDFDVEVLKVLFMIKYIADKFSPNLDNLTTLMVDNVDTVRLDLKEKLRVSLAALEEQKFIIKNGDDYIFLTNEEQDINREILEIGVEQSELLDELGKEMVRAIFDLDRKFKYNATHHFGFNFYLDEKVIGNPNQEIGLRVVTPYYPGNTEEQSIAIRSAGERNVFVVLPNSIEFGDELRKALQIEAFDRRGKTKTFTDTGEQILASKRKEARQRRDRSTALMKEAVKKADIYINGQKLSIKEKDPKERVNEAFTGLIEIIYSKLNLIKEPFVSTEALRELLKSKQVQNSLNAEDNKNKNHLALTEMYESLTDFRAKVGTATLRSLVERFSKAPYGWLELDVAGIMLGLFKEQKIRLEVSGESITIDHPDLINFCTKTASMDKLVVKVRESISPALITNAKKLAQEVFVKTIVASDEDTVKTEFQKYVSAELSSIDSLLGNYSSRKEYPGKSILEDGKKTLTAIEHIHNDKEFFNALNSQRDDLEDYADDVSAVKQFFLGEQRAVFDKANDVLEIFEQSRIYVTDEAALGVVDEITKIIKMPAPYSHIPKLVELREQFMTVYSAVLDKESQPIFDSIQADRDLCLSELDRHSFKDKYTAEVKTAFDQLKERLENTHKILEAIGIKDETERRKLKFIKDFDAEADRLASEEAAQPVPGGTAPAVTPPKSPVKKTKDVSLRTLLTQTNRIETVADIDSLLSELKQKLETQLAADTVIRII